jgi:quercetin dioxygenase-like cupin family protein
MDITRRQDLGVVEGPDAFFTGKATITGQFQREAPSRVTGAIVHFEPGARTAWHSHPLGQTLIVTEGVGWTQVEGGAKLEFHAGDVLWCPPEHKHWHGATPHEGMTHIAIQEALDGRNVTWMEKVTDEQYLAGTEDGR